MKKINVLLVFLISSLTLIGISFIDGKIWDIFFLVVGMIAYAIVGILFSIGVLHGKQAGKDAYAFVFFLLTLGGYGVYKGLEKLKFWIISWPLAIKIIVPSVILLAIIILVIHLLRKNKSTGWLYVYDKTEGEDKVRYVLGEIKKTNGKTAIWFGVNPSTAKPNNLDSTLELVKSISMNNHYDNWIMLNLYPQRATKPDDMDKEENKIISTKNIKITKKIIRKYKNADIVFAFGNLIEKKDYLKINLDKIKQIISSQELKHIAKTKKKHPKHPLYNKKETELLPISIDDIK